MTPSRRIVIAADAGIAVRSSADVASAIGACFGADGVLFAESDLAPEFFVLSSGLAGELMQKLVNYRVRAAFVVTRPERHGARFVELAREHASHPVVRFVRTEADGVAWLAG